MLFTRRNLLKASSCGFGYMALQGLTAETQAKEARSLNPLAVKTPHFAPRAKRVIMLTMQGGPTHLDTFDYKPNMSKSEGQSVSLNGIRARGPIFPSPWKFLPSGKSGLPISELFPHLSKYADELCLINSMYTDVPNHPQAFLMLHTGEFRFTRPSVGSWILYGLGSENQDLPGFVSICPPGNLGGAQNYSNAFLPASYQATRIGEQGQSVREARVGNLSNAHLSPLQQQRQLGLIQELNKDLLARNEVDNAVEGVINSFELGFRMQHALPEVLDLSRESSKILDNY
jgi:hypothetical protein